MIWVVWRRQRAALLAALGLVAAAAVAMVAYRLLVTSAAAELGLAHCLDDPDSAGCTGPAFRQFSERFVAFHDIGYAVMFLLPVVVGVCAGAGLLARELEQGTAVFALTQSVSRRRWYATGLLVAGVPAAAAVALLTPLATWALSLHGSASYSRVGAPLFQMTGLAPAAYTLLAFTVAAVAGMLQRNALGGAVVAVVVQFLLVVGLEMRRFYAPADEVRTPLPPSEDAPVGPRRIPDGGLELQSQYLDAAGRPIPYSTIDAVPCGVDVDYYDCLRAKGAVEELISYHGAAEYWPFQLAETGILLAAVALLLGVGARSLRRIA